MSGDSGFINPEEYHNEEVLFDGGGTADCYRLIQNNRIYCVKRPKPQFRDSKAYMNLFYKEFELGIDLEHPNIVRYFAHDTDEKGPYIKMEYVDGDNLEEFVAQHPGYFEDKKNRKRFLDELLSALEYLHNKKMLHLDLKPRNILITRKYREVKLIDLGFGWSESFLYDMGYTRDYCAPEQALAKTDQFSPATDIYALGKILQHFGLAKDDVVRRCLKEDPQERFQNIAELRRAIRQSEHKSKANQTLLGLAAFILVGGILWLLFGRNGHPDTLPYPEGAVHGGLFSVNTLGNQVVFSKGNLQYQASTNTWRFAEHPWDYVGNDSTGNVFENGIKCDNSLTTDHYEGWIDLFAWGSSGYDHGAECYQPWMCDTDTDINFAQYAHAAYGCDSCDLNERTGQADWGYNAIVNGGNQEGLWRTLTMLEWRYLLTKRNTESGWRYAKAVVNEINGIILFPDHWDSNCFPIHHPDDPKADYPSNTISVHDWEQILEANGAVFLPASGIVSGREPWWEIKGFHGAYWSATRFLPWVCWHMFFNDECLVPASEHYPHARKAVRLVSDK